MREGHRVRAKPIEEIQAELFQAARPGELAMFAALLAHEVSQPLAAIANYAEAARQLAASRAPEDMATIESVLDKLDQQAARVARIVRDQRAALAQRRRCSDAHPRAALGPAIADAVAVAAIGARAGPAPPAQPELALAPDLPPAAIDPVQLRLVIFHLVRNAYDAMTAPPAADAAAGSVLAVRARRAGDAIEIAVADSGPGVASPAMLFQPLASTKPGGLGIGLALCKAMVEAHDGRLWYEPGASGGAVFRFTVPIADAATNDAEPAA
jgi:two-component system sensor kinase FixL